MKEFYYENQGSAIYLVAELNSEDTLDAISLGMLTHNDIPGFAKANFSQINDKKIVRFDVTAKIPVSQYLMSRVKKSGFLSILAGIVSSIISAEEYMLDASSFVLDLNYIFIDISTKKIAMICLPVENIDKHPNICDFFRSLVLGVKFDLNENNDYVATLLNYLNDSSMFNPAGFYSLLKGLNEDSANVKRQNVTEEVFQIHDQSLSATPSKVDPPKKTIGTVPSPDLVQRPVQVQSNQLPLQTMGNSIQSNAMQAPMNISPTKKAPDVLSGEKEISWLYLMQHYNKENAALYKAQKARKKATKSGKKQAPNKKASPSKTTKATENISFAVPGAVQQPLNQPNADVSQILKAVPQSPSAQQIYETIKPQSQQMRSTDFRPADFGDTIFADSDDQNENTSLFMQNDQSQKVIPTLIRKRNNERIKINVDVFRIGRDSSFNNYAVTDNRYIGHTHCHIISRDGEFFLVDDNSKNHTFLDGQQIPPSTEIKLSHGQKFRLSDEEFEFLLY